MSVPSAAKQLFVGSTAHYETRALLSALNSSPDNIRAGSSAINSGISNNLDLNFQPGAPILFTGNVVGNAGPVNLINQLVRQVTPTSNMLAWQMNQHSNTQSAFVIDPVTNQQLSSGAAPTPAPNAFPVLITNPANPATGTYYT